MKQFHTDQPITGSEISPDRLGREKFSALVGESLLLKSDSPGIVVSIEGPWGYGKTSAINLIQKYFESLPVEDQPIIVGFNPWMVSGTDNLTQEFLVQLAAEIGKPDRSEESKNVARQLLSYSKIFTAMKFIPGAEPWATIAKDVIESVGDAADAIGKLKELSIEDKRDNVVKAISVLARPVVVFIDDIDRLPPDEVFHMIRMVKAVADFPRVAFVLALDPDYVTESLKHSKVPNASLYLDKIIQVRLPLPVIEQKAIEELVNEEFGKLAPEVTKEYFPGNQDRLPELYHTAIKHLLRSARDVRKLFNNIRMREPHMRGEVVLADLIALEVLAIKAPEIYGHLRSNPAAYTGMAAEDWGAESPADRIASFKDERKKYLDIQEPQAKRHIEQLLELLFPQLNVSGDERSQNIYSKNGRIAAHDRLMVALKYGLPISEVSLNIVRKFVQDVSARASVLFEIGKPEIAARFVELLALAVEKLEVVQFEDFVEVLVQFSEQPVVAELDRTQTDALARRIYREIWRVLRIYLNKLAHDVRLVHIRSLMMDYKKAGQGALALDHCLRQSGLFGGADAVNEAARWCTQEELETIKSLWIEIVRSHATRDKIFALNGAGHIFFLLHRIDSAVCANVTIPLLDHDEDVDALVKAIGEKGADTKKGRYAHITDEFLDSIQLKERIRERVQQRLDSDANASTEMRAIYMSVITGKKFYLVDASEGEPI